MNALLTSNICNNETLFITEIKPKRKIDIYIRFQEHSPNCSIFSTINNSKFIDNTTCPIKLDTVGKFKTYYMIKRKAHIRNDWDESLFLYVYNITGYQTPENILNTINVTYYPLKDSFNMKIHTIITVATLVSHIFLFVIAIYKINFSCETDLALILAIFTNILNEAYKLILTYQLKYTNNISPRMCFFIYNSFSQFLTAFHTGFLYDREMTELGDKEWPYTFGFSVAGCLSFCIYQIYDSPSLSEVLIYITILSAILIITICNYLEYNELKGTVDKMGISWTTTPLAKMQIYKLAGIPMSLSMFFKFCSSTQYSQLDVPYAVLYVSSVLDVVFFAIAVSFYFIKGQIQEATYGAIEVSTEIPSKKRPWNKEDILPMKRSHGNSTHRSDLATLYRFRMTSKSF